MVSSLSGRRVHGFTIRGICSYKRIEQAIPMTLVPIAQKDDTVTIKTGASPVR